MNKNEMAEAGQNAKEVNVKNIVEQIEALGVEINETPVYCECYRDMVVNSKDLGVENMERAKWIHQYLLDVYTNEDLISGEINTDIHCEEIVSEVQTKSPNWEYDEYESETEMCSNVEFFIKVWKTGEEYNVEVVE